MSASANEQSSSASVLLEAARHEHALAARIAVAEQEAQKRTAHAHEQAAAHITEASHRMERDIAEMRRQAAAEREREQLRIAQESEQKVAEIRAKAAPNVDRIRQAVVARILPAASANRKGDA